MPHNNFCTMTSGGIGGSTRGLDNNQVDLNTTNPEGAPVSVGTVGLTTQMNVTNLRVKGLLSKCGPALTSELSSGRSKSDVKKIISYNKTLEQPF